MVKNTLKLCCCVYSVSCIKVIHYKWLGVTFLWISFFKNVSEQCETLQKSSFLNANVGLWMIYMSHSHALCGSPNVKSCIMLQWLLAFLHIQHQKCLHANSHLWNHSETRRANEQRHSCPATGWYLAFCIIWFHNTVSILKVKKKTFPQRLLCTLCLLFPYFRPFVEFCALFIP